MAHNKLGITGPMEVPSRHFPWQPIFLLVVFVALLIGGGLIFSLSQDSARPISQFPGGIPEADLKANLPATVTQPTPKKILAPTAIMLYLGRTLSDPNYGVGIEFSEEGSFPFPVFITKSMPNQPGDVILAAIPDPQIREIGGEWEGTFTDLEYSNNFVKVKMIKVARTAYEKMAQGYYDYEIIPSMSWDGGKSWRTPPWVWPTDWKKIDEQKRASSN